MAQKRISTISTIIERYEDYHVEAITTNRFRHSSLMKAVNSFEEYKQMSIETIGTSEEGREIKGIQYGTGKTKILLWSQMHGNESTATRAILDLLNFLVTSDEFDSLREGASKNLTLLFIPMLNPDGAERFQRRTSSEIDMNRDAVALQTPEAKLLSKVVDTFKPDFAFNLHDQRRFYNVSGTEVPSSISFLAPAFNHERAINEPRKRAMQLIAGMNEVLQQLIPKGVGLYDDTYSHRSFGDYIQSRGISTILVESGWTHNDIEKEQIRKLNFVALLKAFDLLISKDFEKYTIENYRKIPAIDTKLFDVLIKNANAGASLSRLDMGVNRYEYLLKHPKFYSEGQIDDLGDLSSFFGFETIDASQLAIVPGKAKELHSFDELSLVSVKRWLRQGILFLLTTDIPYESHVPYPINIVHPRKLPHLQKPVFEGYANFLLVDNTNSIQYIVMNGFAMKPDAIDSFANGLVIA